VQVNIGNLPKADMAGFVPRDNRVAHTRNLGDTWRYQMNWDARTHYKKETVAERYDKERFSSLPGRVFNALEKFHILRALGRTPVDTVVLDLPCGTGRFAEVLLEAGYRVVGVDISPAMLDVARRKLERFGDRFRTQVADVKELAEQEQNQYDVALCARVLMHFSLPEQISFLKSVTALTRRTVIFTQSFDTPYQRFRRGIKRALGDQSIPARHPISEPELQELLAGAGLKEVRRIRPMPLLTEAIYVIAERV
jgi:SAM-dependent methyltransferase